MRWCLAIMLLFSMSALADESASDVITYTTTPCFGKCPVYRAMLFRDGTFIFDGQYFVAREGVTKVAKGKALFEQALGILKKYQFQQFHATYAGHKGDGCKAFTTDSPSHEITLQQDGETKSVLHNLGCRGFPREAELKDLEQALYDLMGIRAYTKGDGQ